MKLIQTTAIAGLLLASGVASAIEISGNVALTTDYVWRGVSQTDGSPAIQGGFDADLGNGLYAGVWGSNVDFVDDASIEVDLYGGWAGEFSGVGVDIGYIHYHYPTESYQLDEIYAGLSYGPVTFTQYFDLSLDNDDELGNYSDLGLDLVEYNGIAVSAHAGFYDVDSNTGGDDYWDYKLAASTSMFSIDWELALTGTDENASSGDTNDEALILTVSKSL